MRRLKYVCVDVCTCAWMCAFVRLFACSLVCARECKRAHMRTCVCVWCVSVCTVCVWCTHACACVPACFTSSMIAVTQITLLDISNSAALTARLDTIFVSPEIQ